MLIDDSWVNLLKSEIDEFAETDLDWMNLQRTVALLALLIRSAALEEAAKVADELALALIERPHTYVTPHKPTQDAIATAIRALKDKPHE